MAEVPIELPTGRVVGKFIFEVQDNNDPGEEPQLVPVTGDIIIKSAIDNLTIFDQSLGKFVTFRGPHKAIIDSEGELATPDPITGEPMYTGMSLWSNDSDKLSVKGWTYTATFNLKTADGKALNLPPATFTLATGQEVDLADVIKVPATPGYGLPQAEGAALRAEAAAQVALDVKAMADAGEFDGAQGLPGNATMRVATAVGTRVFVSDGVTEHMVSGEIPWRALVKWDNVGQVTYGTMPTGLGPNLPIGGGIFIKRFGPLITCSIVSATMVETVVQIDIPFGYRSNSTVPYETTIAPAHNASTPISVFVELGSTFARLRSPVAGAYLPRNASLYGSTFTWSTTQAWPTSLPGTPA